MVSGNALFGLLMLLLAVPALGQEKDASSRKKKAAFEFTIDK